MAAAAPPVAKKVPRQLVEHGDVRVDNYYWLRDDSRSDPDVLAHLRAENDYTAAVMSGQSWGLLELYAFLFHRVLGLPRVSGQPKVPLACYQALARDPLF
jgi:oligopeptidase B